MTQELEYCVHDMVKTWCSWCLGMPDEPPNTEAGAYIETGMRTIGRCMLCNDPIMPGDEYKWRTMSGQRVLVGECCFELQWTPKSSEGAHGVKRSVGHWSGGCGRKS